MTIFKNEQIPEITKKTVNNLISLNRVPQSILLTGDNDSLKMKCAYELAASVICEEKDRPCGKCTACKKSLNRTHPDITVIEPTEKRKLVSIDDIRANVTEKLYITPNESENKVFILTDASEYSVYIQNALLKSIEEPPEDCMFIFLCDRRTDMLPTIVSRSTEINIGDAPEGKPRAKDNQSDTIADNMIKAIASGNEYALMEASAQIGKDRDILDKTIEKFCSIIRDALTGDSNTPTISGHPETAELLSEAIGFEGLLKLKELADETGYRSSVNCNVGLTVSYFTGNTGALIKQYYGK